MRNLVIASLLCATALAPGCGGGERVGNSNAAPSSANDAPADEDGAASDEESDDAPQ